MDWHIERFLKRVSTASIAIATLIMILLLLRTPESCVPSNAPPSHRSRFPSSTCDSSPRQHLPLHKKNSRLWSSKSWINKVSSYSSFFLQLQRMGLLHNHSKALCLSCGTGLEVMSLARLGVSDLTAVDLVDSPPLVNRADPHNLPFFDDVFDFAFTHHLPEALFPVRFASEMERTVHPNGVCVIAVDECSQDDVNGIARLFFHSKLVHADNVTLFGSKITRIVLQVHDLS